jgi:NAD(P)-dependent dehydrogenase (short-subunit alcohol dehydrogenase family)
MSSLSDKTAVVVGASRGLGRSVAIALAAAGARVVAVSRTGASFPDPVDRRGAVEPQAADGADGTVPASLLDRHDPDAVILVAGAPPHMRPLHQQTWETFSVNWNTDVRIAFQWAREALLKPLKPGSRVVVFSSGVALSPTGSPLSGGFAGAKVTQRLIAGYAQEEARRAGSDLTFTVLLLQFAPETGVGQRAIRAYAAQAGQPVAEYLEQRPFTLLSADVAGNAIVDLLGMDANLVAPAYVLSGDGLEELP